MYCGFHKIRHQNWTEYLLQPHSYGTILFSDMVMYTGYLTAYVDCIPPARVPRGTRGRTWRTPSHETGQCFCRWGIARSQSHRISTRHTKNTRQRMSNKNKYNIYLYDRHQENPGSVRAFITGAHSLPRKMCQIPQASSQNCPNSTDQPQPSTYDWKLNELFKSLLRLALY